MEYVETPAVSGHEQIRMAALAAAARSTVNPGNVIRIATRYAHFIEHGTDPGEGMQMADANGVTLADENPAVEDSSPELDRCPECGHLVGRHSRHGCHSTVKGQAVQFERCPCRLPHGKCGIIGCKDHNHV